MLRLISNVCVFSSQLPFRHDQIILLMLNQASQTSPQGVHLIENSAGYTFSLPLGGVEKAAYLIANI
jgi:hypothetical protein